jgi:hypothetical protein
MDSRSVAAFIVLSVLVIAIGLAYVAVNVSANGVTRIGRVALYFTDFESVPSNWITNGGSWSGTTGFKGNGLQGSDNDGGLGTASQYLCPSDMSSYNSLWVSVKAKLVSGSDTGTWYGLAFMTSDKSRMYVVEVYSGGEVWYATFNVETYQGWNTVSRTSISGYSSSAWYTIVVFYNYTSSATYFRIWVYDSSGKQVAYLDTASTSGVRFAPTYIGLFVDSGTAAFDDFIISAGDPRYVTFVDIPSSSYKIGIYDSSGSLVNSTVVNSSRVLLSVVNDIVVGTGSGGSIVAWDPNGNVVMNYTISSNDAILGGDVYSLGSVAATTVTATVTTTVTNTATATVTQTQTMTSAVTTTVSTTVTTAIPTTVTQATTVTSKSTITSTVVVPVVSYRTATTTVTVSAYNVKWDWLVIGAMLIVLGVSIIYVLYRRR